MVELVEVGPRDGLQNESKSLSVDTRIAYIDAIVRAGVKRIEAVSFVRDDRVPQMAGAEEVMASVPRESGVSYIGLVMNRRGAERAVLADVDELNYVLIASETFSQRNQGASIAEAIQVYREIVELLADTKVRTTVTIGAAFGCPFEGNTPLSRVVELLQQIVDIGVDEVALADTIGVAVPREVEAALDAVREVTDAPLRLHLHNTRNTGYANALAGVARGVGALDTSTGGIGGCPFAPKATGNIATEDLLYQLQRTGHPVDVDFDAVVRITEMIVRELGKTRADAMLGAAGWYP